MQTTSLKTPDQIILPSAEIENLLQMLKVKIDAATSQCEGGSIVSFEVLKTLSEIFSTIAEDIQAQLPKGEIMVKRMERIITQILENNTPLSEDQIKAIDEYIEKLGAKPINCGKIAKNLPMKEIRVDIGNKTIIVTVYTDDKGEVKAWRINRQETKLQKWLDRLFESRSSGIILTQEESVDFLNTIEVREINPEDQKYDVSARRTFVEIILFDGRRVQLTIAAERQNNSYIATWKSPNAKGD